jgi:outer membrane protein assembly factor BamB
MTRGASRLRRSSKAVVRALLVAIVLGAVLHFAFGLTLYQTGSGMPWVTFGSREARFTSLERHRAAQLATAPTPTHALPTPATTSAATPAASASAAATQASTIAPAANPAMTGLQSGAVTANAPAPSSAGDARALSEDAGRAASSTALAYWTDFRGPARDGRYDQMPIVTTWPEDGLRPIWKQLIGLGYSSFVAAGGRLFTIERRRNRELVVCYDAATGREIWTRDWDAGRGTGDGPRATPTWHEGRVYALGAEGHLAVLDARTGTPVWQRNILTDNGAENLSWGMAASPLVVDDKVIVLPGGTNGQSVVAYHKDTGARLWSVLNDHQAYTTPMIATLVGLRQIVIVTAERAVGLTVDAGRLLWEHPWVTDYGVNAAQPIVVGENRLFLSAGYGHGAEVLELTREGDRLAVRSVWHNTRMKNKFASSVLHEGYIYGLDEAILACIDAATGDLKWKGGRYGYGQIVLASGHVIVAAENGDLALVRATPTSHQEVARFAAIEGKTWNHPALADGRLFIRNGDEMAAFDLRQR